MKFNCINKKELDNVYIHDAKLSEIKFDNEQKSLKFVLEKVWRQGTPDGMPYRKYQVVFSNVLGFQMNTYSPWGATGGRVRGWADGAEHGNPVSCRLRREWEENRYAISEIDDNGFVEIGLEMSSGDLLLVACESIEVCEAS